MSKTAVESSGDVNVMEASHLLNLPTIATDAFTSKFIVLPTGVTSKTGGGSWHSDGSAADAKKQRTTDRVLLSVRLPNINFLPPVAKRAATGVRNNRLDYHIDLCTADTVKCDTSFAVNSPTALRKDTSPDSSTS